MSRRVLVVGVPGTITVEQAASVREQLAARFGIDAVIVPATALAVVELDDTVEGETS